MDWTAIGSIGTLLAVAAALFKKDLESLWRAPILKGRLQLGPPDSHKTFYSYGHGTQLPVFYIRLWVTNVGKTTADDVQVMAANLLRRDKSGGWEPESAFQPMNLRWAHGDSQGGIVTILRRLPPGGIGRHCDVAHVYQNTSSLTQQHGPLPAVMELDLEVSPNTGGHFVTAGEHMLEVRIGAANAKTQSSWFFITFGGNWHDQESQMFGKELRIDPSMPPSTYQFP